MRKYFTVEQLKIYLKENETEGYLAHSRVLPRNIMTEVNVLNGNIKVDNNRLTTLRESYVNKLIDSILTKWLNRELMMKNNVLSIETILEDLRELLVIEDGLLNYSVKQIVKKLNNMLNITDIKINANSKNFIVFLEPFKISRVNEIIKIPNEMLFEPMDITRSKVFTIIKDNEIEIDENKLNLLLDFNNNLFIIDMNMHNRLVMKVFTNKDIISNQVVGL